MYFKLDWCGIAHKESWEFWYPWLLQVPQRTTGCGYDPILSTSSASLQATQRNICGSTRNWNYQQLIFASFIEFVVYYFIVYYTNTCVYWIILS